ncbi:hypothetical protein Pfo_016132 [Paulownia fortunei]|nr:hypothetical protein Pfo_016132 [Paulownia fortunei]
MHRLNLPGNMVSFRTKLFFILFVVSVSLNRANAVRILHMEEWLRKQVPLLESLPRGPVPPSSGSPCTYIPGQGSGTCPLNEKHFAGGGSAHAPPASPRAAIDFVATSFASGEVREKDSAS